MNAQDADGKGINGELSSPSKSSVASSPREKIGSPPLGPVSWKMPGPFTLSEAEEAEWQAKEPSRTTRVGSVTSSGSTENRPRLGSTGNAQAVLRRRSSSSTIRFGPGTTGWSSISSSSMREILRQGDESALFTELKTEEDTMIDNILSKLDNKTTAEAVFQKKRRRRTNIVCAIGPASRSVEKLTELLEAGMNIARLNFSHGDHAYHLETFNNIKEAVRLRQEAGIQCHCAILMDTKGPEIRTGFLKNHESIQLKINQDLEITTDYTIEGDSSIISCSYEHLCSSAYIGGTILIADGAISCKVTRIMENSVMVRVENNATLGERKNMNIPGVSIRLEGITEKDKYDIEHFALKYDIDIISGSFIRTAANVRSLRECLKEKGRKIRVHAKIESVEGLRNIQEIIAEADGIHVSRGDLGMELPLSKLFLAQKAIIHWANLAGKPVVTSTQMLDSMTARPRPTNAECNDVANAVLDGTDCMMLSAETASGLYPRESVETMARIIAEAEVVIDYEGHFSVIRDEVLSSGSVSVMEALASSAVESAMDVDAPLIVLMSETGRLGVLVAKYRPLARILVVTSNPTTARQMSISRGVSALLMDTENGAIQPSSAWVKVADYCLKKSWVEFGDRVVIVSSPLDGDLNKDFDERGDFKSNQRHINCVEIRVIDELICGSIEEPAN